MNEELKQFCTTLPPARRVAIWFAVFVVCALLFPVSVRSTGYWTCGHCRARRTTTMLLGWKSEDVRTNEFTTWYEHNRPAHEHRWINDGAFAYNLFSIPLFGGCRRGAHPLTLLDPASELEFVQTATPEQVEMFFIGILSTNRGEQWEAFRLAEDPTGEHTRKEPRLRERR